MAVLILFYSALMIAVLIHEIGHLIAVRYTGYELVTFAVGPLAISFKEGRWIPSFRKGFLSGVVHFQRTAQAASLKNEVIVASGGILANILVGTLFVWLYFTTLTFGEFSLFIIVGVASIIVGVANLFPRHYKSLGLDSDGMLLIKLYRYWRSQSRNPA